MSRKTLHISKNFADRLVYLMRKLGFKERQHGKFARKIGISDSFLSNVLNLQSGPSFHLIYGISNEFPAVNIRWLLTGEGLIYEDQQRPVPGVAEARAVYGGEERRSGKDRRRVVEDQATAKLAQIIKNAAEILKLKERLAALEEKLAAKD